jgi:pyruvate dehydrogenase E2 component (dihydrolipoamide acetyltransferase)
MPRLGWTMEEGVLVEWLKKDGDPVQVGEIIFTVESDKALNEVEAFESGILRIPPDSPQPGTTIPVGGLLAYLVQPGESFPSEKPAVASVHELVEQPRVVPTSAFPAKSNGLPAISPRARRVAQELGVDWTILMGSGRTGRIVERDVRAALQSQLSMSISTPQTVEITPVARRAAEFRPAGSVGEKRIPVSRVRRVVAERMSASAHTTAPVTLTTEVDATELVKLRKQLKGDSGVNTRPVPTYTDLLAKLCAVALEEHPMLNARLGKDEIVLSSVAHIGFAVDTERGLFVPVIRDVGSKNLRQIAAESQSLVESARAGTLKSDIASTFTITNLGMYEIDAFTPIINLPECAILGVGRIKPKQVVIDADAEQIAIRHMMFLSLTFDHRLVDGAPAARFLQRIKQFVEQPYLWLIG